jgi:hypothetical protein
MDLVQIGWSCLDLIGLAQDSETWRSVVKPVINLPVP